MQTIDSPLAVIQFFGDVAGLRILDVGCGGGGLTKQLWAAGAIVSGIDPEGQAVSAAAAAIPNGSFTIGSAEDLPFGPSSFDRVVMINTLHHVTPSSMPVALSEAVRVLAPDGFLIVIEPTASGNFFEALRLVEDETEVRAAAQAAIELAAVNGAIDHLQTLTYVRRETFDSPEKFLERILAVDPARLGAIERNRSGIWTAVLAAADRDEAGKLIFHQPSKADIFRPPGGNTTPNTRHPKDEP